MKQDIFIPFNICEGLKTPIGDKQAFKSVQQVVFKV